MGKKSKDMSISEVSSQMNPKDSSPSAYAEHLVEFENRIREEMDAIEGHVDNLEEMRDRLDSLISDVTSGLALLNQGVDKLSEAQAILSRDV